MEEGNLSVYQEQRLAEESAALADQLALYRLLAKQTERYCMGESSSVPVETAGELLASIQFCLRLHAKASPDDTAGLEERFDSGQREAWRLAEDTKPLLTLAERTAIPVENQSYQDTLRGIGEFFRRYDYRFFAHDIPCMIDYQLCIPVPDELLGVEYIREYLLRLIIENKVYGGFDPVLAGRLLSAPYADCRGLLVNLFEPVFTNALGRLLLGRDMAGLGISLGEGELLFRRFRPWREAEAKELVRGAVDRLCDHMQISGEFPRRYLRQCGDTLLPRMRAASPEGWGRLFAQLIMDN